jgi:hypothetical protein
VVERFLLRNTRNTRLINKLNLTAGSASHRRWLRQIQQSELPNPGIGGGKSDNAWTSRMLPPGKSAQRPVLGPTTGMLIAGGGFHTGMRGRWCPLWRRVRRGTDGGAL